MKTAVPFLIGFMLCLAHVGSGQVSDTVVLENVKVTGRFLQKPSTRVFDTLAALQYHNANLADVLTAFNGSSIRRYGPGGAATVSLRGYTSQQIAVKWNNVDVTNPMLSQTDLSLLPVFFFDAVDVNTDADVNDHAPAGSVDLEESFVKNETSVSGYSAWSSLQNFSNALRFGSGGKHLSTSVGLFSSDDRNTFRYSNAFFNGDTLLTQTHGESKGLGGSGGLRYTTGRHSVHAGGFHQQLQRNIPPTMLQQESTDEQSDESSAAFMRYVRSGGTMVEADASAVVHAIVFHDGVAEVDYNSRSSVYRSSVLSQQEVLTAVVHARVQTSLLSATILPDVYRRSEWQHDFEAGVSKQLETLRIKLDATAQQRLRENDMLPFNYTTSLLFSPTRFFGIKITHALLSRLPGLNDRYWRPGGNPDLKSERALRNNVRFSFRHVSKKIMFDASCDVYYDKVDNWIQWIPSGSFWSPRNVKSVLLYGANPTLHVAAIRNKGKVALTLRYNYNKAITQSSFVPGDASVDRQLMYVPLNTVHADANFSFRKTLLFVLYNYSGKRFTTSDNQSFLEPYMTLDAGLSHTFVWKKISVAPSARVDNISGTDYQLIAWSPMPRRVYTISLNVQFSSPHQPKSNESNQP